MEGIDMELQQKWEKIEGINLEFQREDNKFIEERKKCEEKVKLFDELIKMDGEEWRVMVADLNRKEYEDQQKRFKEMEQEEQEDWDRHLEEVGKRLQMIELFKELGTDI